MFIYFDIATPRLMLSILLINVSRQGPMLMANVGCCFATLIFGGHEIRQKLWDVETLHASKASLSCESDQAPLYQRADAKIGGSYIYGIHYCIYCWYCSNGKQQPNKRFTKYTSASGRTSHFVTEWPERLPWSRVRLCSFE